MRRAKSEPEKPAKLRYPWAELEARERERIARGDDPRIFYHPGFRANGIMTSRGFKAHGLPDGWEIDAAAWEAAGGEGSAPIRRAAGDGESEEDEDGERRG